MKSCCRVPAELRLRNRKQEALKDAEIRQERDAAEATSITAHGINSDAAHVSGVVKALLHIHVHGVMKNASFFNTR